MGRVTLESKVPAPSAPPVAGPLRHITCGSGLTMALHDIDDVLVVGLYGPVGPSSQPGLQAALNAVFTAKPPRIAIDASCITDCDRRGLAAFVDAAERAASSGIPFALSGLARRHMHLMEILWRPQVTAALSYPDLGHALAAVTSQLSRNDRTREELLEDVDELHQALIDSRVVEQATGILMAVYGFTADDAMAMLASHAETQLEPVPVLAGRVIGSVQRNALGSTPSTQMDVLLDDIANAGGLPTGPTGRSAERTVAPSGSSALN